MLARLGRLLSVRSTELSFVALSALLVMLAMAVNVLVLGTVTALFLSASTRGQLPLVYAAGAVFGMIASALLTALGARVSRAREVAGVLVLLSFCLAVAFFVLPFAPPSFLFVVHPVATGLSALAVVQAFALINDCLDAEQAKRLLPTIGAGGTLGAMLAGGAMAGLAPLVGADRCLLLAAVLGVGAAFLSKRLVKSHFTMMASAVRQPGAFADLVAAKLAGDMPLREVFSSRLLQAFALLQLVVLAGSTCLKFSLESSLQAQLGVDHIARFLGLLNLAANGAVLAVQTLLEARVLRRFGLWVGLLAMPFLLLGGGSLLLVSSSLSALAAVRFGETVARFSLARTAEDLVLLPLPSAIRRRGKTFIASAIMPAAVLLGSLLILSVDAFGGSLAYVVMFLLGVAGVVLVRAMRSRYLTELRDALSRKGSRSARITRVPLEQMAGGVIDAVAGSEGTARVKLLRQLRRHRLHGATFTLPQKTLANELGAELRAGFFLRLLRDAQPRAGLQPLQALAVQRELDFHDERVHESLFGLLSLAYAPDDMHRCEIAHLRGDRRVRAFAIEVLNQMLDASVRSELMPYLGTAPVEEQLQHAGSELGIRGKTDLLTLLALPELPKRLRPLALYVKAIPPDSQEATLMTTLDKTFALRSLELFSRLSPEELHAIAELAEHKQVTTGTRVFGEGDPGDTFYVVLRGDLQVTRGTSKIASLKQGECFGEMALFDQGPRMATVTASSECELSCIGDEDFRALLERTPSIAVAMLAILARRATANLGRTPGA